MRSATHLLRINAEFWDDPSISPAQSNALVHELIDLWEANGGLANRQLSHVAWRLVRFFSRASRLGLTVETLSD